MNTKGVIRLGKPLCEKVDLVYGEILTKHAGLWRGVGLKLGLESYLLDNIEEENHLQRKRFEKTLEAWIKQDQDNATWGVLELAITNANRAMLGLERLTKMPSSSSVPHQPNSQYGMEIKPEMMAPSTIPPIGPPNINTATGPVHHSVDQPIVMVAQPPSYFFQGQQPIRSQNAFQLVSDPQYQSMVFQQPYLSHQQVAYPQTQPVMNQQGHQLSAPSQQGGVTIYDEVLTSKGRGGGFVLQNEYFKLSRAVCRIQNQKGHGTGFVAQLLLKNKKTVVLVTACHTIDSMEMAENGKYTFCEFEHLSGVHVDGKHLFGGCDNLHILCPKALEDGSPGLDFFMGKVNLGYLNSLRDSSGRILGIEPISLNMDTVSIGDAITVIQHPGGGSQCKSQYTISRIQSSLMFYECDTRKGSSGSPVLKEVEQKLRVVGVHRGAVKDGGNTFNCGSCMSSILQYVNTGQLEDILNLQEISEGEMEQQLGSQANTSALPTAPQQAGLQNMQYGMNPSIYPTMPLNPAGAFLPSNHLSSQFVVQQYYFQQQPQQPHQPIFTQQQLQYFQSQQPQNQAMTLHQEGYPQSQPGMIQQDHQSSKLPITLQQGTRNKPHIQDLNEYVPKICSNWYDLGIQLLDRSVVDKLDVIKENNPRDVEACCTAMFKFWISNSEDASWKMLVEKLRKIGLNVLAKKIENEHCK